MNDNYALSESAIHNTAVVSREAVIGKGVTIEAFAYVGSATIEDGVTVMQGAVIGREPARPNIFTRPGRPAYVGAYSVIGSNVTIYTGVSLGKNVLIGDGARIRENTRIGDDSIIGSNATIQNDVNMGERSRVVDLSHITAGVVIGDDVFISTGVLTMNDNSFNHGGPLNPPIISDGVSIGGGAILLPGVFVGPNAIVAAGAVVTKYVYAGTRVQGVPAKRYYLPPVDESLRLPRFPDTSATGVESDMKARIEKAEEKLYGANA